MRILLAQKRTSRQTPLVMALAQQCCPLHLTIVDRSHDFLRAAAKKHYDCVIIDASLLDNQTAKRLHEAQMHRLHHPILVVLGKNLENTSLHILPSQTVHRIDPNNAVNWSAWANRLLSSIRKAEPYTGHRPNHLVDPKTTPPNRQPPDVISRERLEQNLLNLSMDHHRNGRHACVLISVDPIKTDNDHDGSKPMPHTVIQSVSDLLHQHVNEPSMLVRWTKNHFLVLRPDCTLADAWIWSERIRRSVEQVSFRIHKNSDRTTVRIGIVDVETRNISSTIVDQADRALRLAQQKNHHQICTGDMVAIEHIVRCPAVTGESTLSGRRTHFLAKCRSMLGPNQFEHLTDHADRVSQVAIRIAQKMVLPIEEIHRIRIAALLHDIGKCLIPEQILAKPSALSIEEFQLMSLHAPLGSRLVAQLGASKSVVAMVYHHHTRYDRHRATGSHHLQTPLGARVLCVADAFVTMTSDRTYRPAHRDSEAMHELRRQRGSQFDPDVVDAVERVGLSCLGQAA